MDAFNVILKGLLLMYIVTLFTLGIHKGRETDFQESSHIKVAFINVSLLCLLKKMYFSLIVSV